MSNRRSNVSFLVELQDSFVPGLVELKSHTQRLLDQLTVAQPLLPACVAPDPLSSPPTQKQLASLNPALTSLSIDEADVSASAEDSSIYLMPTHVLEQLRDICRAFTFASARAVDFQATCQTTAARQRRAATRHPTAPISEAAAKRKFPTDFVPPAVFESFIEPFCAELLELSWSCVASTNAVCRTALQRQLSGPSFSWESSTALTSGLVASSLIPSSSTLGLGPAPSGGWQGLLHGTDRLTSLPLARTAARLVGVAEDVYAMLVALARRREDKRLGPSVALALRKFGRGPAQLNAAISDARQEVRRLNSALAFGQE
jgi:hypothetical protein